MKIQASITGSLLKGLQQERRNLERSVVQGIHDAGLGLKKELRQQVVSAGLGVRLSNTWRQRDFNNDHHNAATLVYSKAPHIMRAFDRGEVIKSRDGFWLAIPTVNAPKRGTNGKKINPSNFPEHRFGPLRFIYRRKGPSLLVVENVRITRTGRVGRRAKGGPMTKTGRMKSGMTSVVMFLLVPHATLPKKLDVARATEKWTRRLPELIDRRVRSG
ncbi:MAG: hypothetical protein HQL50_04055 [Magnetococcales bacterium]|nr:hypothetical protein [Magnetococcales bacterium]